MSKVVSITLNENILRLAKVGHKNFSKYVEELIKADIYKTKEQDFYDVIVKRLKEDGYIREGGSNSLPDTDKKEVTKTITGSEFTTTTGAFVPKPPDPEYGYPCCLKNAPCKHWEFNGVEDVWINSLTGKIKTI